MSANNPQLSPTTISITLFILSTAGYELLLQEYCSSLSSSITLFHSALIASDAPKELLYCSFQLYFTKEENVQVGFPCFRVFPLPVTPQRYGTFKCCLLGSLLNNNNNNNNIYNIEKT